MLDSFRNELRMNVRAGVYHMRVTHTSDTPVSYSLTGEYTTPFVQPDNQRLKMRNPRGFWDEEIA